MAPLTRCLGLLLCTTSAGATEATPGSKQLLAKHVEIKSHHHQTLVRMISLDYSDDEPASAPPSPADHEVVTTTSSPDQGGAKLASSNLRGRNSTACKNATNTTGNATFQPCTTTTTTTTYVPPAGNIYGVDATSDPHKAWRCLEARQSNIQHAGRGLFATCPIHNNTLLGEYRGYRFMIGERGSTKRLEADWAYIWKVPRCLAPLEHPVVITRTDKKAAHKCSNEHQFVYVDAKPLDKPAENPLRFVNAIRWIGNRKDSHSPPQNVDAFFADDRVWYYTNGEVKVGDELIVDYGPSYWADAKTEDDSIVDMDWGTFVNDF